MVSTGSDDLPVGAYLPAAPLTCTFAAPGPSGGVGIHFKFPGPGPPSLLSAISVFLWKSVLYGAFVWARRALIGLKWRFPARAVVDSIDPGSPASRQRGLVPGGAANSRGPRVMWDPLAPPRGPIGPSPERESGFRNAPALAPGSLARLQDLQLLTEFSPQVPGLVLVAIGDQTVAGMALADALSAPSGAF